MVQPDELLLGSLEDSLGNEGWEVTSVESVSRAWERLTQEQFHLVVVATPTFRRGGLVLTRALRARRQPVLLIVDDAPVFPDVERLARPVLEKPYGTAALFTAMARAIR